MIFLTKHNPWKNYNYHICLIYELNYNKPSNYLNNNIDIKLKLKKKFKQIFLLLNQILLQYSDVYTLPLCLVAEKMEEIKKHDPIAISHNT